jgi:transcriptional regulator with XRE-family HTH domain
MAPDEMMARAGKKLRRIRERRGLSVREVQRRSDLLARERGNREYFLSRAWVMDIEAGRFLPGIFKTVSLSVLYDITVPEIHAIFGIKPGDIVKERALSGAPKTHLLLPPEEAEQPDLEGAKVPEDADLSLQMEKTNLLSRLIAIWGDIPVPALRHLDRRRYLYGYIGLEDRTMEPLLPPGTLVQIDVKQTRIARRAPRQPTGQSPFDRPIYFLDVRDGYRCGWCEIKAGQLTLIPHPNSPEEIQTFRFPSEVDVVGRVIGVAMRIARENAAVSENAGEPPPVSKK